MTTTHVFIVDDNTLKYHLEHLFAGTGAKDYRIDFNNSQNSTLNPTRERLLLGMIADLNRIRIGDFILFYLQQNKSGEGKFYGIFKAKSLGFLDNNDENQYLQEELQKSLTFRILIEPFEVYPEGITEWEALDEIKGIQKPSQMIWSLIYRKLRANRGNTMITLYESERLFDLIKNKNKMNKSKKIDSKNFSFNTEQQIIVPSEKINLYNGRKEKLNIFPRLIDKYKNNLAFESHLQAFILQNLEKDDYLNKILIGNKKLEWIGNEVACGVGMQRIDILLSFEGKEKFIVPIELKSVPASLSNKKQIHRYIDWLNQYYLPNNKSKIQPILISKKFEDKNSELYTSIVSSFKDLNEENKNCLPLRFIEFHLDKEDKLIFEEINY